MSVVPRHIFVEEALAAKESGEEKTILFGLSGHGLLDMQAYDDYNHGLLPEFEFSPEDEAEAIGHLPEVPIPG